MTHPSTPRLHLFIIMTALLCLPIACATTQSLAPMKTAANTAITASKSGGKIIRPEADSVCRGYQVAASFETRGCTVAGPYPGELSGEKLTEEMSLEEALAHCVQDSKCSGISASWYVGAKFIPVASQSEFRQDGGSYACTFTVTSCAPRLK